MTGKHALEPTDTSPFGSTYSVTGGNYTGHPDGRDVAIRLPCAWAWTRDQGEIGVRWWAARPPAAPEPITVWHRDLKPIDPETLPLDFRTKMRVALAIAQHMLLQELEEAAT